LDAHKNLDLEFVVFENEDAFLDLRRLEIQRLIWLGQAALNLILIKLAVVLLSAISH
jgi:hypothetical protein